MFFVTCGNVLKLYYIKENHSLMKVFISSSQEAIESGVVKWISDCIKDSGLTPKIWNSPELFPPGSYTYHNLIKISETFEASIFVFSEDDEIFYREKSVQQPRDNVLIEYGLFSGNMGMSKAIICIDGNPKQSTNLKGITYINVSEYNRKNAKNQLELWARELINTNKTTARIALFASSTNKIINSDKKSEALIRFYKTFFKEIERTTFGINTCGSQPIRQVIYEHYFEQLKSRSFESIQNIQERICWFWFQGDNSGFNYTPPIYKNVMTNNFNDRTEQEINNSNLLLAITGGTATLEQLKKIIEYHKSKKYDLAKNKLIILGWFGGAAKEFIDKFENEISWILDFYPELEPKKEIANWENGDKSIKLAEKLVLTIQALL